MKILLLAPHPFYQHRGTPIAVDLVLKVLSRRGDTIDLLTYHEGNDVHYPHVTIHRIKQPFAVKDIGPGPSFKKLICDGRMFFAAWRLARRQKPDIVHAVEESVFMALVIGGVFRIPYIFDMDSSMPQQIIEKYPRLRFVLPFFNFFEGIAIRRAVAVIPVCRALADIARRHRGKCITLLRDISLLETMKPSHTPDDFKGLPDQGVRFMYIGNLEKYQGMDLLLESFSLLTRHTSDVALIIVGGTSDHIEYYKSKATQLGIDRNVHFTGPQPIQAMSALFHYADVLVSPRTKGINTPMKIYSYLHSGKAVLATRMPTHTQVLQEAFACLADPRPEPFAQAMHRLTTDERLRRNLGGQGKEFIETQNNFETFKQTLNRLYDTVR